MQVRGLECISFYCSYTPKRVKSTVDGADVTYNLTDTGGTGQYSAMRDTYIKENESFVIGYSVTSQSSLEDLKSTFFPIILKVKDQDDYTSIPAVLVGYKDDQKERQVSFDEGKGTI